MDESLSVRRLKCVGNLVGNVQGFIQRKLLLPLEALCQRLTIDIGRRVEGDTFRFAGAEHRQDIGMLERGRDPDFPLEALGSKKGHEVRTEYLYCHKTVLLEIAGEIDRSHA